MKRRLIHELQDSFARHPVYSKIVNNIQSKYAFTERPQFGIVVKGSGANKISLSADNYIGQIHSYVMLAYVGAPTHPLEWVREDQGCIAKNGGVIATPPGIYYLEILSAPSTAQGTGTFVIDPLITVTNEQVLRFVSGVDQDGQLQNKPIPGTLRLWESGRFMLKEGIHYTVDYQTGAISFLESGNPNARISADYRYELPTMGPFEWQWNKADWSTLPGVVLAFGKRGKVGDKVAVVVYDERQATANAYGGLFDVSFDFDIVARDPVQMEEISDLAWMYLFAEKRPALSSEGIEVTEVSIGGESEEPIDETAQEYMYSRNMSLQVQTRWELHVPLPLEVSRVEAVSTKIVDQLTLSTDFIIPDRSRDFERIM